MWVNLGLLGSRGRLIFTQCSSGGDGVLSYSGVKIMDVKSSSFCGWCCLTVTITGLMYYFLKGRSGKLTFNVLEIKPQLAIVVVVD